MVPAAVLYYKIDDPLVESDGQEADTGEEILSKLRVDGLISEEREVLGAFDRAFDNDCCSYESKVAPIGAKKDGALSAKSKTAKGSDFDLICRYAVRKASEIGEAIIDGEVAANPVLMINREICDYCSYHSICRFNPNVSAVKDTPKLKESEIIAAMINTLSEQ